MPGINIAEVIKRQKTTPDPVVELFLFKTDMARALEAINVLLSEAYEQLGDVDALQEQVAAKLKDHD